jgi:hypothetical protein
MVRFHEFATLPTPLQGEKPLSTEPPQTYSIAQSSTSLSSSRQQRILTHFYNGENAKKREKRVAPCSLTQLSQRRAPTSQMHQKTATHRVFIRPCHPQLVVQRTTKPIERNRSAMAGE